jgi:hypothetical protein
MANPPLRKATPTKQLAFEMAKAHASAARPCGFGNNGQELNLKIVRACPTLGVVA